MKTKHKDLFVMLMVVVLVQLSCDTTEFYDNRSERDKDKDNCEEKGGIWHDTPYGYCEMPAATNTPTPTLQAAVEAPQSTTDAIPIDILQCDASSAINEVVTLVEDSEVSLGRTCSYTLLVTNISDQRVYYYYYWNSENSRHTNTPEWLLHTLNPGESYEVSGSGVCWVAGTWGYTIIDRLMAIYYIASCRQNIDYTDEAALAELFAFEVQTYCGP